jgi:hypothetical protein
MTRDEVLQRLQTIEDKGSRALRLLESKPLSAAAEAEIQSLARGIKEELKVNMTACYPSECKGQ